MPKTDVWMPLVIGDYLADTTHLSTAEHGAYLLLLMTAWTRGGPLPDDDAQLARITRASAKDWKDMRAALAPFFTIADGEWRQKRLLKELAEAKARVAKAEAKAAVAAAARWGKDRPPDAPSIAQALPEQCPSPSPSSSTSLRSVEKSRARKESPIADDYHPSTAVLRWAEQRGWGHLLPAYLETFVGRNRASGKVYRDWDQAFMNAVREDWYGLRAVHGKEPTLAERRALNMDILTGRARHERTIVAERVDSAVVLSLPADVREQSDHDVGPGGPERTAAGMG